MPTTITVTSDESLIFSWLVIAFVKKVFLDKE